MITECVIQRFRRQRAMRMGEKEWVRERKSQGKRTMQPIFIFKSSSSNGNVPCRKRYNKQDEGLSSYKRKSKKEKKNNQHIQTWQWIVHCAKEQKASQKYFASRILTHFFEWLIQLFGTERYIRIPKWSWWNLDFGSERNE